MKRMILAVSAAIMMGSVAMAQDENQQRKGRGDRKFDQTEMVKRRTDNAVSKYKLNEEQAKKLLELNTKYAKDMAPRMRPGGPRGGERRKPQGDKRPEMTEEQKAKMEEGRKQMEERMKAYNNELKTILTEAQFKSYSADMEKRAAERQRPERK